jgi:hypothetical protein
MKKVETIYNILQKHKIYSDKDLDAYIHALVDIKESIDKIYNIYLENITNNTESKEKIVDSIWDIREEFRHINYHIEDAKLLE